MRVMFLSLFAAMSLLAGAGLSQSSTEVCASEDSVRDAEYVVAEVGFVIEFGGLAYIYVDGEEMFVVPQKDVEVLPKGDGATILVTANEASWIIIVDIVLC